MGTELRDFLEIPYDELEELNLEAKAKRSARTSMDTLREERSSLEARVDERTAGLARKTEQLRATSYIARKTAEV